MTIKHLGRGTCRQVGTNNTPKKNLIKNKNTSG